MKVNKLISHLLILIVSSLCVGNGVAISQEVTKSEKVSPLEAYATWRKAEQEKNDGKIPQHVALSAVSRRLDTESAKVDLAIVGNLSKHSVEITSLYAPPNSTNHKEYQPLLDPVSLQFDGLTANRSNINEPTAVIRVTPEANALQIKLIVDDPLGVDKSTVLIMPLGNHASSSVFGLVYGAKKTASVITKRSLSFGFANSAKMDGDCVTVSASCCSGMSKQCKDGIGNVINCVACSITCGTDCPPEAP